MFFFDASAFSGGGGDGCGVNGRSAVEETVADGGGAGVTIMLFSEPLPSPMLLMEKVWFGDDVSFNGDDCL